MTSGRGKEKQGLRSAIPEILFIFLVIFGKIENIAQGDAAGRLLGPDGIIENRPGNGDPVQERPVQDHLACEGCYIKYQ